VAEMAAEGIGEIHSSHFALAKRAETRSQFTTFHQAAM
jgi:hypothetical protein